MGILALVFPASQVQIHGNPLPKQEKGRGKGKEGGGLEREEGSNGKDRGEGR